MTTNSPTDDELRAIWNQAYDAGEGPSPSAEGYRALYNAGFAAGRVSVAPTPEDEAIQQAVEAIALWHNENGLSDAYVGMELVKALSRIVDGLAAPAVAALTGQQGGEEPTPAELIERSGFRPCGHTALTCKTGMRPCCDDCDHATYWKALA